MTVVEETPEQAQLRKWIEVQFDNMGRHVVTNRLIEGDKAEGRPMWAMPGKLFIGKIWDKEDENNAWWIISGAVPTDHLSAKAADTPRAALRHLCLKWQMQSGRLEHAPDPSDKQEWTGIGENLASQAEALYPLVDQDELWRNTGEE